MYQDIYPVAQPLALGKRVYKPAIPEPMYEMPVSFVDVFSQYELLLLLGRHLSYPDLLHLGQANKDLHSLVLSNSQIRTKLKGHAICSGEGLMTRRSLLTNLKTIDEDLTGDYVYAEEDDDPQAYLRTCQTYDSRPCMSCGEAVCEVRRSLYP